MSTKRTASEAFGKGPDSKKSPEKEEGEIVEFATRQAKRSRIGRIADEAKKLPVILPAALLIADTFFDSRERFEERYNWTVFQQLYFDVRMKWVPFGVLGDKRVEAFRKIEDREERKAKILAYLLTNSALHHYGSYELSFLLEYVLIPRARFTHGMFPEKMRAVLKRVAELMELGEVELSKGSISLTCNHTRGEVWAKKYETKYWDTDPNGRLPTKQEAKEQIFYSFLWAIAEGGCQRRTMMQHNGVPKFHSLRKRDY